MEKIAILIACYNESGTIGKVVSDCHKYLPEANVYVFDNNSTDDSADKASKAGAIVLKESRQGKGNVIRSMFRHIDADCYVMVDADDTYGLDNVREMCRLVLEEGVDMVVGDRLSSTYFVENKRLFHNSGNRLVRYIINSLFDSDVHDIMTGYRAMSRVFVKNFPVLSKGFEIETEMTIHALDKNFIIRELPVVYRDRPNGSVSKLNTVSDGFKVLNTIISLYRNYQPYKFFSIIALLLSILSMIMFVPILTEYWRTGLVPRFPTLIVSAFTMLFAILMFVCGLILDVINKKHKQLYELCLTHYYNSCRK